MDARKAYQPQLDGLRAIAIIPVVLYHVGLPGFRGGYVGVDVFFVLSGFLITRLLVDELQGTGTIRIAAFYARRVRRLFPALATVVAVVLLLGTFLLSAAIERQELSKSATATMAFVSNFYLWRARDAYFVQPAGWTPLLNMWTLSVEEQFYLLWPLLLMWVIWLGRRFRSPALVVIAAFIGVFATSFALFWFVSHVRPAAAFYLTPARCWEFALGGGLAVTKRGLSPIGRFGGPLAALGLFAIVLASTVLQVPFFIHVATAAFGASAVIAGISGAPAAIPSRVLQMWPLVAIGRLSYSWYLWHWPLLVFNRILAPSSESLARALCVAIGALALAALTFVFIENPIRFGRPWPFSTVRKTLLAGGLIIVTVSVVAGVLDLQANATMVRDPWLTAINASARRPPSKTGCVFAQTFTELAPALQCAVGTAGGPLRILVWGDSQAHQLIPLLEVAGERGRYAAVIRSMSSCPPVVLGPLEHYGLADACRAFNRAVTAELPALAQAGVTGIVLASRLFGFRQRGGSEQVAAWRSAMREIFSKAHDLNLRILLIAPIPSFPSVLPQCLAHASAEACGGSRAAMEEKRKAVLSSLREVIVGYDNVRLWDPFPLFCDANSCTPVHGGVIMYADAGHLSIAGARSLAASVTPELDWLRSQ